MPVDKTVKMKPAAHASLKKMAAEDGRSIIETVSRLVEEKRRERFLQAANRDYAALRKNRAAWEGMEAEREELKATLSDGLNGDEWPQPDSSATR